MYREYLLDSTFGAFVVTLIVAALVTISFFAIEPSVGRSATENFTVTQTVTGAISFLASTSPVVMNGALDGLTGGTSLGTTTSRVRTNNVAGYSMTIKFASTSPMIRNGGSGYIPTYMYSTTSTNYLSGFDTSPENAQFGFSVNASSSSDVSPLFKGNGTTLCGSANGTTFVVNNCWHGASSTDAAATTQLISSSAPTPASGSTSTVQFRITIPNNPSPAVPDGTYTATATLTATDN